MPMPAVMTAKGLFPVSAILGILEMALIVPVSLSCLDLGMPCILHSVLNTNQFLLILIRH